MQLPPASYDFSALYPPGTYPNTPRELFGDVFYPNENLQFPRRYLDEDFFETLFEDVATRYKGIYIHSDPTLIGYERDYDSNRYLNKHLYRRRQSSVQGGHLVGLERNLEYAPFFLTFWEGRPMIGYVWEKDYKPVFTVGYLDDNQWYHRPSIPPSVLIQNDGRGWYSERFILFPMLAPYSVLNYPEGI